jgi:monofunctional chorismate mutase
MTAAARREAALRVGLQGEEGCFSHSALRELLGDAAEPEFLATFADALDALEHGQVERLLLPVYNSLAGTVAESLRAIARHDLRVDAEHRLPVRLVLAALPDTRLDQLTRVWSHPIALRQCGRLLTHHPQMRPESVHDTAGAARLLVESGDRHAGVVTSEEAAQRFGLAVLLHDVQDRADNATTFWLLARRQLARQGTAEKIGAHLAAHLGNVAAVRGAIPVERDDPGAIASATGKLLAAMAAANRIRPEDAVSCVFTLTPDLCSAFPALAARQAGWHDVPMLCATEVNVPGALPRCLRVLLHVRPPEERWRASHVYLGEARGLRPDL